MNESCGMYVVMRAAVNPNRDEWTNYGLLVYGADGVKAYARVDYARAVARGDLDPDRLPVGRELDCPTLADAERAAGGLGHAMSSLQMTAPRPTLLLGAAHYDRLFRFFCAGSADPTPEATP